jgi:hypothetical protein
MVMLAEFESRKRMMATEGSEELKSWEREIERLKWLDEESRYPVPPFFDARRHHDFMSSMRKLEETLDKPGAFHHQWHTHTHRSRTRHMHAYAPPHTREKV